MAFREASGESTPIYTSHMHLFYLKTTVVEPPILTIFEEITVAVGKLECRVEIVR